MGKHIVYTDGESWPDDEGCDRLKLKHYLHSSTEKNLMERVNQYFKVRIETFDDLLFYYSMYAIKCNLLHIHN